MFLLLYECNHNKDEIIMQAKNTSKKLVDPQTGDVYYEAERLRDKKNGKKIEWEKHKKRADKLAEVYEGLSDSQESNYYKKRAMRILECGAVLVYHLYPATGEMKLFQVHFCKVRLCPMCSWRRSLKCFGQMSKVMNYLEEKTDYEYLLLTLTAKNVTGDMLSGEIDRYLDGFKKMTRRKEYKAISRGHFRSLEITRNWGEDTYHPHIHAIIAVNKSYFTDSAKYLSQKRWAQLWQDCMGLDYEPRVHVKKLKPAEEVNPDEPFNIRYAKAVAEVAKYTVKSGDVVFELRKKEREKLVRKYGREVVEHIEREGERLTPETVMTLDSALRNRRLIAYGGELKCAHKLLSLDDAVDGDLINTDGEENIRTDLQAVILEYRWVMGLSDYFQV